MEGYPQLILVNHVARHVSTGSVGLAPRAHTLWNTFGQKQKKSSPRLYRVHLRHIAARVEMEKNPKNQRFSSNNSKW